MEASTSDEPILDLYTIPSYSSWFSWGNIHEIERISLREFFDGSSITRNSRIYKEYRDFIISKYREDPSRRLTFTELRKSLVGDVSTLHKVFTFLEKWGLINFSGTSSLIPSSAAGASMASDEGQKENGKWRIRVEEGAPHGVRVVAAPNSLKPVNAPPLPAVADFGGGGGVGEMGSKFTPLASYSDIYEELMMQQQQVKESVVCESCKEHCDSGHYEYIKGVSFDLCRKCFDNGNYDKDKSIDDFKFVNGKNQEVIWTEAETLLLLESILKHGDDWELVVRNVKTKTKLDCISKLLQLPFGDLMLGTAFGRNRVWDVNGNVSSVGQIPLSSSNSEETVTREDHSHKDKNGDQQNGTDELGPPQKRLCTAPVSDDSSSLIKQVARLSTVVGPHVTASAAEAAVAELCYENRCSRDIFDDDNFEDEGGSSLQRNEQERVSHLQRSDGDDKSTLQELQETTTHRNVVSLTLRTRAATATALGAAAAHAKLLANQEEREIEHLVATILETQLKKLQGKAKHLEDLELIMEKQHNQIEEVEESIVADRLNILQEIFSAGISNKWKDLTSLKPQASNAL